MPSLPTQFYKRWTMESSSTRITNNETPAPIHHYFRNNTANDLIESVPIMCWETYYCIFYCGALVILLPSIATTFLLLKKHEGWDMKSRSMTDEDKEVKPATKYIVVTCIFFYSTVILFTLFLICNTKSGSLCR